MPKRTPYEIIAAKQNKETHSPDELKDLIAGYMDGTIPDYQMAAWLMAVYFNGMSFEETASLTNAMLHSGEVIRHEAAEYGPVGDKHSTGGVGDKITLLLAPLVSAAGLPVPTISGRGLGFTGGTLDKLASIPGLKTALTGKEFRDLTAKNKLAFAAQTESIVPADKRIYALRDVTSTVQSLPLITSSIMSKKVAEGITTIVFDVKCGIGAYMQSIDKARELSNWLIQTAKHFDIKAAALITFMNEPLGWTVGNWLEMRESIEALRGDRVADDIKELTLSLGGTLLFLSGLYDSPNAAYRKLDELLQDGSGWLQFKQAAEAQGGKFQDPPTSTTLLTGYAHPVIAKESGYISSMNAREMGFISIALGAGRIKADDVIDLAAGIEFHKKKGDSVVVGDTIATLFAKSESLCKENVDRFEKAVVLTKDKPEKDTIVLEVVTESGSTSWDDFKQLQA